MQRDRARRHVATQRDLATPTWTQAFRSAIKAFCSFTELPELARSSGAARRRRLIQRRHAMPLQCAGRPVTVSFSRRIASRPAVSSYHLAPSRLTSVSHCADKRPVIIGPTTLCPIKTSTFYFLTTCISVENQPFLTFLVHTYGGHLTILLV